MDNPARIVTTRVATLLDLPEGFELEVDWDLIWANAERVQLYLDVFKNGDLNDDEKRVLMELIIASYDEFLNENPADPEFEKELRRLILENFQLHNWVVRYWSAESRPDGGWNVTPMIRGIVKEAADNELDAGS